MNFARLKHVFTWLFAKHAWETNEAQDIRTCPVCGRTEELDFGGGHSGSIWVATNDGNRAAHVAMPAVQAPHQRVASDYAIARDSAP